jgi:hypothetical protein
MSFIKSTEARREELDIFFFGDLTCGAWVKYGQEKSEKLRNI